MDYFCKKICYPEVEKIAQSGHTGSYPNKDSTVFPTNGRMISQIIIIIIEISWDLAMIRKLLRGQCHVSLNCVNGQKILTVIV